MEKGQGAARASMRANSSLTQPLMDFGKAFTALHRSTCADRNS